MRETWLVDWRRQTFEIYQRVRSSGEDPDTLAWYRWRRDELFGGHPSSPLPEPGEHAALPYYPRDPSMRVIGEIDANVDRSVSEVELGEDGVLAYERMAVVRFTIGSRAAQLALYSLRGYGGGLFLPFADATSGADTYGGGRYLYDTVKGADLGVSEDRIVLDFNYAYNPSCAYDPYWVCPLAPLENRLPFPVEAGERAP